MSLDHVLKVFSLSQRIALCGYLGLEYGIIDGEDIFSAETGD
jgi:hypothetical protein